MDLELLKIVETIVGVSNRKCLRLLDDQHQRQHSVLLLCQHLVREDLTEGHQALPQPVVLVHVGRIELVNDRQPDELRNPRHLRGVLPGDFVQSGTMIEITIYR